MSETQQANLVISEDIERKIAKYLRTYPDFFIRHMDLLETLRIPHPCHPAVSLIERQLLLLREQNGELRKRFKELVAVARDNDYLSNRMQNLALTLIEARRLDDLVQGVKSVLRDNFNADFVALRLAGCPVETDSMLDEQEFVAADGLALFEPVLRAGRPLCGHFGEERTRILFRESAPEVASAALVPLRGADWQGMLAVGSRDEQRFHSGMGTLFLSRMGELIAHALQPYLRSPQAAAKPRA